MDSRKMLLLLLSGLALMTLPATAISDTYKLPVRTATLGVEFDHYLDFVNGVPVDPYDFQVDPEVLRIGDDPATGWTYESMVIFDWGELDVIPEGTLARVDLYLTSISVIEGNAVGYWTELSPGHAVPVLSDFDWGPGFSLFDFGPSGPQSMVVPITFGYFALQRTDPGHGYEAIPLIPGHPFLEIAGVGNGLGLGAPYVLATTVPEPSSLVSLGVTMLSLGGLLGIAKRKRIARTVTLVILAFVVLATGQAFAQDEGTDMNSEPGSMGMSASGMPTPGTRDLPDDFKLLPAFPRLFWSFGCAPTTGAMLLGYYDNAGFPRIFRNPDGSDAVFPTTNYPSDNKMFLRHDANGNLLDSVNMYPSRCALSATEMGVFGQTGYGHVDDYYYGSPFTDLTGLQTGSGFDPYYPSRSPHTDNCIADYMGTSHWQWRHEGDGSTFFWEVRTTSPEVPWGVPHRWTPAWGSNPVYPIPYSSPWTYVDGTWGLAQYISQYAGYRCKTTSWTYNSTTYQYEDIADFYNLSIAGYRTESGAVPQDVVDEIDAGRPVLAMMHQLNPTTHAEDIGKGHVFPVFGYKWTTENGQQRLKLLAYDTWFEDRGSSLILSYRIVDFPNADEIPYRTPPTAATGYFTRESSGLQYKLYEFAFLQINNNDRCPLPLGTNDYTSGAYADEFDIGFDLPAGNSRVHYDSKTPTPASPAVTLDANGDGTLHIDQDCVLNFRTYRDATPPDGYLASDVVHRVYSVFSANKNIKKYGDDTAVTMVNGIVTHVVDSNNFYFEERDKRLFGIRVHKANHGLATGDEVEIVVGSIETDSANDERYVDATSVTETDPATKVVTPYGMKNASLSGRDYLPPGGSGTGYGQKGVVNSASLNNIGMLVRTVGEVTYINTSSGYFTISDASGAVDSGSHSGVKVSAVGFIPSGLAVGDFVTAAGICSTEKVSNDLYPVVIARGSDDLLVVQ